MAAAGLGEVPQFSLQDAAAIQQEDKLVWIAQIGLQRRAGFDHRSSRLVLRELSSKDGGPGEKPAFPLGRGRLRPTAIQLLRRQLETLRSLLEQAADHVEAEKPVQRTVDGLQIPFQASRPDRGPDLRPPSPSRTPAALRAPGTDRGGADATATCRPATPGRRAPPLPPPEPPRGRSCRGTQ